MSNNSLYSENLSPPPSPPHLSPTASEDSNIGLNIAFFEEPHSHSHSHNHSHRNNHNHNHHQNHAPFEDIPLRNIPIDRLLSRNHSSIGQSRSTQPSQSAKTPYSSPNPHSQDFTTFNPSTFPLHITPAGRSRAKTNPNLNKPLPHPPPVHFHLPHAHTPSQANPFFTPTPKQRRKLTPEQILENPYHESYFRRQTIKDGVVQQQTVCESVRWFWQKHSWKVKGFVTGFVVAALAIGVWEFVRLWLQARGKLRVVGIGLVVVEGSKDEYVR